MDDERTEPGRCPLDNGAQVILLMLIFWSIAFGVMAALI